MKEVLIKSSYFTLMNVFRLCLVLLLPSVLLAETAEDDEQWYEVEVIIFKHRFASSDVEYWPETGTWLPQSALHLQNPSASDHADSIVNQLAPLPIRDENYGLLPLESLWLNNVYQRINASSRYEVVYRTGWRQKSMLPNDAKTIALDQTINYASHRTNQSDHGTVRLYKTRYLHLDLDLTLSNPDATPKFEQIYQLNFINLEQNEPSDRTQPQYFSLKESRRFRSLDIHYFDHPMFGAIVQARKAKMPEEAPAEQPTRQSEEPLKTSPVEELGQ